MDRLLSRADVHACECAVHPNRVDIQMGRRADIDLHATGEFCYGKTPLFFALTRCRDDMARHIGHGPARTAWAMGNRPAMYLMSGDVHTLRVCRSCCCCSVVRHAES